QRDGVIALELGSLQNQIEVIPQLILHLRPLLLADLDGERRELGLVEEVGTGVRAATPVTYGPPLIADPAGSCVRAGHSSRRAVAASTDSAQAERHCRRDPNPPR